MVTNISPIFKLSHANRGLQHQIDFTDLQADIADSLETSITELAQPDAKIDLESKPSQEIAYALAQERKKYIGGDTDPRKQPTWDALKKSTTFLQKLQVVGKNIEAAVKNQRLGLKEFARKYPDVFSSSGDLEQSPQAVKDMHAYLAA